MAISVTNLKINLQEGTGDTAYATWDFDDAMGSSGGTEIPVKVGSIVKVISGSKWYNGAAIDPSIFYDRWVVFEVSGDRAVLNWNRDHTKSIMSPINIKSLEVVG